MIQRLYLRLFDRLAARPALPFAALTLLSLTGLAALPGIRLDLSFRPLFADSRLEAEATREFESVFGQASGAYIGATIQRPDILSPGFLEELEELSRAVESLPGVTEVVSLPRLAMPMWSDSGAHGERVMPLGWLQVAEPHVVEARLSALARDPRVRRVLLSEDGDRTLLLARLGLPLSDLEGRRAVISDFREVVAERLGTGAGVGFVGVSVVEAAYARIVLESLARSFGLTTLALLGVLWLVFRRVAAVAAVMTGVALAIPVSIGIMTALGQNLTMVNSMVPVMILVIGVADGIHMLQAFALRIGRGEAQRAAVRGMFEEMALPCLLTTATTAVGFLALRMAEITAIRDFGLNVAVGVVIAYLFNLVVIPSLLTVVPATRLVRPARASAWSRRWSEATVGVVVARPASIAVAAMALTAAAAAALPGLTIDQRFNEEVAATHPIRADQAVLEREFSGFLGPDVSIVRTDGSTLLNEWSLQSLAAYVGEARAIPGVLRVESVLDLLPEGVSIETAASGLMQLRADPLLGSRVSELLDASGTRMAVMVRTEDVGTRRALELGRRLESLAEAHLGDEHRARLVGQWWLAQRGMDHIVTDMLTSFTTSCLLILPLLALALRRVRLVVIAVLPNILPMLFALAFMSWTGITLRIGTAMILAIALGIAIDDTIHMLARLKHEGERQEGPEAAVGAAIRGVGGALTYTTLVLVLGFLSMLSNDLIAIREMGLVAAATLSVALLADLYVAPALFLLAHRRVHATAPSPAPPVATGSLPAADLP